MNEELLPGVAEAFLKESFKGRPEISSVRDLYRDFGSKPRMNLLIPDFGNNS